MVRLDGTDHGLDDLPRHRAAEPRAGAPNDAGWYQRAAEEYTGCGPPIRRARHSSGSLRVHVRAGGHAGGTASTRSPARGAGQLEQVPLPDRSMSLHQVLGEGAALAMLIEIGDGRRVTRGTVVLTFDADDLILSERSYWDWCRSVERSRCCATPHDRQPGVDLDGR